MAITLAAAARLAECNATIALLNSGVINIYAGSQPDVDDAATGTLLVTMTFDSAAFAAASDDGTNADALAASIASATGITDGVASYYRCVQSDTTTTVFQGSITGSAGGGDMQISNTSITTGGTVEITSFTYRKTQAR